MMMDRAQKLSEWAQDIFQTPEHEAKKPKKGIMSRLVGKTNGN